MPTFYEQPLPADPVHRLLAHVVKTWHEPLHDAEVRIGVLFASEVKHDGFPAYATIRVVPLKDRVTKQYDAELLIDSVRWDGLDDDQRAALLDHEVSHLALVPLRNGSSGFKRDAIDRPRLRGVRGDTSGGDAFAAVIGRHGPAAIEFENARRFGAFAEAAKAAGKRP